MDKTTFEKEVLHQTQPNYALGVFNQVAIDRITTINTYRTAVVATSAKVDFMYLYCFAAAVRTGFSQDTINDLNDISPEITHNCIRWFDRHVLLANQVQQAKNIVGSVGILQDGLRFLHR